MDFNQLAGKAKEFVDEHGGVDELKKEAEKLRQIAGGEGTLSEKAKAASTVAKEYAASKKPPGGAPPPQQQQ
jgi:hypothetical protein